MRLSRVGEPFDAGEATGQRGLLTIGPLSWPTVERWDVDTKLSPDRYTCEFGWWAGHSGIRFKAIRVLLTPEQYNRIYPAKRREELRFLGARARGRIYLHSANVPSQLEGCIAPGMRETETGVAESRRAMLLIFEALGGWEESKKFEMEVA
jgi:hypothetical protein